MPSIADMNKTSCYSFLDKHPASARNQARGKRGGELWFSSSNGAVETGSPDARQAPHKWSDAIAKVSWLPEAQDGTSKHKQKSAKYLAKAAARAT